MLRKFIVYEGRKSCPNCDGNIYFKIRIDPSEPIEVSHKMFGPNDARDAGVKDD